MSALSEYTISSDKEKLDENIIHNFLSNSYWSKDIPLEIVRRSIENSLCFGVYFQKEQVGFARVITDYATFGYLADVFIVEGHRGKGLSKKLMEFIMANPQLQELRGFYLRTRDAHDLYKQFGFAPITKPENFMQLKQPENFYSTNR